jgi:hypothetical protein
MKYMRTHTFQTPAVKWDGTNVEEVREFLSEHHMVVEQDGGELVLTCSVRIPLGGLIDFQVPYRVPPDFEAFYKPVEPLVAMEPRWSKC